MSAAENFKRVVADVWPMLQAHGFRKRGTTFFAKNATTWKIVNIQKSTTNTSAQVLFAGNLGVASCLLLDVFGTLRGPKHLPHLSQCHWSRRLGASRGNADEQWWALRTGDSIELICEDFSSELARGLTLLEAAADDEALRDLWLTGEAPGLTELQRLRNLATLLGVYGPPEALPRVLDDLRRLSNATALYVEQKLDRRQAPRSNGPGRQVGD